MSTGTTKSMPAIIDGLTDDDVCASHLLISESNTETREPLFSDFDIDDRIVRALAAVGITRTFAIQALTLPVALPGSDLIGQARTGMGKTLGFGVPLLHQLTQTGQTKPHDGRAPRALVMVPTRELCVQVTRDLKDAAAQLSLIITAVYGGRAYEPQIAALQSGVDLVVGTPGRVLDLAKAGHLVLGGVQMLVLDEADEMLDLGFLPDIERVLGMVPDNKQTMLFSATMPGPIITLARSFMRQPVHIRAELPDAAVTHETTRQLAYRAHNLDKPELLARLLQADGRGLTMVFTRTKRTAQKVADDLTDRGFAAAAVHGDLGQGAREQALRAFRHGKVDVLVATDVAARGIDVDDVTHVVNYQCPDDEKTYIHRIGRTGRAGHSGTAVTLVDWDDLAKWQLIDSALELGMTEPPETYSNSEHLYADLSIPSEVIGRLPAGQRTRAGLSAEQVEDLGETGHKPHRRAPRPVRRSAGHSAPETPKRSSTDRRRRRRTRGGNPTDTAASA